MAVGVVTDSTADFPLGVVESLGITVVPIYLRFGDRVYRDGVDITAAEFYDQLATSSVHPATSQPTPEDFTAVYGQHRGSDGIVSIHISAKISGTHNSALVAKGMMGDSVPIDVIVSEFNSAGLALVVMAAARLAQAGKTLEEVASGTRQAIQQVDMLGMFDTMKYLARGGRVPQVVAMAGSVLNVKPLLTFRVGEITRSGLVRSAARGTDRLVDFVARKSGIEELVVVHSSAAERAGELKRRLGSIVSEDRIVIAELGPGLGVHGGPGVLLVATRVSGQEAASGDRR
jgi:DegV family protein with EDD domain